MRNVVMVSVDSLRADHCGFMGYEKDTTPTLDAMAEEGLSFEAAVAPGPSTYESMPAVFTGEHMCSYPTEEDNSIDNRSELIEKNTRSRTIPERFDDAGYTTGAFTTNPYTGKHTNFARGFDFYEDFLDGGQGPLMEKAAELPVFSELKHIVTLIRGDRASKPWQSYYSDILQWVSDVEEPYFLWIFLLDPHTPYLVPDEFRDDSRLGMYYRNWALWASKKWGFNPRLDPKSLISLYDGTIRSMDDFLRQLKNDLHGDPIIAVHADHGEAFDEHDGYGHSGQVYQENIHVPLVVWNADCSKSISDPISLTALPRMLQKVANRESVSYDGEYALSRTLGPNKLALCGSRWKYILTIDPETEQVKQQELYDLGNDRKETENQAEDRSGITALCHRILRQRLAHESEVSEIYRGTSGVEL